MSRLCLVVSTVFVVSVVASAQAPVAVPPPPEYGPSINLDTAKKVAAASIAEARKNGWFMAVAIVDTAGELIYFEKMDNTQFASVQIAQDKARSSTRFKRPTKAMQDVMAAGGDGLRFLALNGAVPVEGGLPIMIGGKIVGAVGISGGTSAQDGQTSTAGAAVVK